MASACLLLARRRPPLALLGYLGILVAAVALLSSVGAIWDVAHDSSQARSLFGVSAVLAIACAHASLLLANARHGGGRMRCGSFAPARSERWQFS